MFNDEAVITSAIPESLPEWAKELIGLSRERNKRIEQNIKGAVDGLLYTIQRAGLPIEPNAEDIIIRDEDAPYGGHASINAPRGLIGVSLLYLSDRSLRALRIIGDKLVLSYPITCGEDLGSFLDDYNPYYDKEVVTKQPEPEAAPYDPDEAAFDSMASLPAFPVPAGDCYHGLTKLEYATISIAGQAHIYIQGAEASVNSVANAVHRQAEAIIRRLALNRDLPEAESAPERVE